MEESAAERKRKRLEAWRKRQQQQGAQGQVVSQQSPSPPAEAPKKKVVLSINASLKLKPKKKTKKAEKVVETTTAKASNPFGDIDNDEEDDENLGKKGLSVGLGFNLGDDESDASSQVEDNRPRKRQKGSKWDSGSSRNRDTGKSKDTKDLPRSAMGDALDKFMEKLQAGAMGSVVTQISETTGTEMLSIDVGGSMVRVPKLQSPVATNPVSGGVITAEDLQKLSGNSNEKKSNEKKANPDALYTASDWESDVQGGSASEAETDDEEEEKARRAFIEALKSTPALENGTTEQTPQKPQLAAEVKNEKHRRERKLRDLEKEAEEARLLSQAAAAPEFGRLYNDIEGGVMEEAERNLDAALAAPDALQVLADLNKKKELKAVNHSQIDYIDFRKNLYIVPRALAKLSSDEVLNMRGKLKIKIRGRGVPAPVSTFEQCGFSERIISVMQKQNIVQPYPVQAQCIPCILAGRDVIGIAKTGSGKTLAYLLPLFRHIADQPPLDPSESGPIGLILVPARELAYQVNMVCKSFTKQLGLKSTAIYGGAGVAEQIADLKRGVHICVATPGRLIDILTMQSGKLLSLRRVSYVVADEADRMHDMGFAPQISAILGAVRPDRQTVLFSATFPKSVEALARKSLKYPVEVIVGGRSVASDNVTQYAELVEEDEKFLRLLQLLGDHVDDEKKALVFVDTQVRADSLFEQLLRNGYPALSLHGGKEQEDRDSTISDFKRKDGPNVLVATGVAGRGLDVPLLSCVINYSCPNHLEAYVHQVGRTGRAGNKGVSYTFVNPAEEAKFAPHIVRALTEAGQADNVSSALKEISNEFKEKVKKGEAKWAGSGFKGKGFTYDSSEMNEAQKLAQAEKRQALIEAGLLDPDDEERNIDDDIDAMQIDEGDDIMAKALGKDSNDATSETDAEKALGLSAKITPEMLALPGMKDAILKKVGILKEGNEPSMSQPVKMGDNHYVMEFEINDYPREARWKVTQKETTSRLQDEFQTAVTLKGEYFGPNRQLGPGERKLYLHLEATSERTLQNCVVEIRRLLNEETLRVGARGASGVSSHKYSVLG